MPFFQTLRRRLALALCRAAGLHDVAIARAELDEVRADQRKLREALTSQVHLFKAIAQQLNSNTLTMKRWAEGMPALAQLDRDFVNREMRKALIAKPTSDLRVVPPLRGIRS